MSPILGITLNGIELARIVFSHVRELASVQQDSRKFRWMQVICGKNAENLFTQVLQSSEFA